MPDLVNPVEVLDGRAGSAVIEVDDMQLLFADKHVARVKVAVQTDLAYAARALERVLYFVKDVLDNAVQAIERAGTIRIRTSFDATPRRVWEEMIDWKRHEGWIPATRMEVPAGERSEALTRS